MPTLRISYPTLVWHSFDVELSESEASRVLYMDDDQKAEFIEAQIKQQDIQHEPWELRGALEVDYATIKRLPDHADA